MKGPTLDPVAQCGGPCSCFHMLCWCMESVSPGEGGRILLPQYSALRGAAWPQPVPASPGAMPSWGMESRILRPLPTDPAWKKRRQAAVPRNCRDGCQETRAGAEPGNFGDGDNLPPTSSVMRQLRQLPYRGAPHILLSRAQPHCAPQVPPRCGGRGVERGLGYRRPDPASSQAAADALARAARRREFLWPAFGRFSAYFHTDLGSTPPVPVLVRREIACGDSFQRDGGLFASAALKQQFCLFWRKCFAEERRKRGLG